jgi:DNA-binding response OmpR family regulator
MTRLLCVTHTASLGKADAAQHQPRNDRLPQRPLSFIRAAILGKSIEAAAMPRTDTGPTIIRFGHFQLFKNRRELFVEGLSIPLGGRAFDILQMLVDAGGDLVTKDEILSRVWPGIIVEENTLQCQIMRCAERWERIAVSSKPSQGGATASLPKS